MMKKIFITLLVIIALTFVASLFIQKETKPSAHTRIILEHHYQSYIAPKCFEQSEVTNYLEDSRLGVAEQLNYVPFNTCTETELTSEKDSLFISLLKDIGLLSKKWDNW